MPEPELIQLDGAPGITIQVKRLARTRRMALKVSRIDGRVTLTMPRLGTLGMARRFAQSKAEWLREALADQTPSARVRIGTLLPVDGRNLHLVAGATRSARIEGDALIVPAARPGPAAMAFLKTRARAHLAERVAHHASRIGREAGTLTLRDTRSRWGSCTAQGNLMFSWRLAMAPRSVLDYVAAHEVAHLVHMNHSPAFWSLVEQLFPNYRAERAWLRREGIALHRYQFTDA